MGCEQSQGVGALDRPGPAVRAELGVRALDVGPDGVRSDRRLAGDFGCGEVAEHTDLAAAERLGRRPWRGRPGHPPGSRVQAADLGDERRVPGAVRVPRPATSRTRSRPPGPAAPARRPRRRSAGPPAPRSPGPGWRCAAAAAPGLFENLFDFPNGHVITPAEQASARPAPRASDPINWVMPAHSAGRQPGPEPANQRLRRSSSSEFLDVLGGLIACDVNGPGAWSSDNQCRKQPSTYRQTALKRERPNPSDRQSRQDIS
jgi:hypothetical protein